MRNHRKEGHQGEFQQHSLYIGGGVCIIYSIYIVGAARISLFSLYREHAGE